MHLTRRSLQKGEGTFGCVLWSLVLVIIIMIAWKMVPIKVASAEFHDFMDDQARVAGDRSEAAIRKAIMHKARELDLPVDPKRLVVEIDRGRQIKMQVTYTVPVDFPGYTYNWTFEYAEKFPIFIF